VSVLYCVAKILSAEAHLEGDFSAPVDLTSLDNANKPKRGAKRKNKISNLKNEPIVEEEDWLVAYLDESVFKVLGKYCIDNFGNVQRLLLERKFDGKKALTRDEKCEIILGEILWLRNECKFPTNRYQIQSLRREIHARLIEKENGKKR